MKKFVIAFLLFIACQKTSSTPNQPPFPVPVGTADMFAEKPPKLETSTLISTHTETTTETSDQESHSDSDAVAAENTATDVATPVPVSTQPPDLKYVGIWTLPTSPTDLLTRELVVFYDEKTLVTKTFEGTYLRSSLLWKVRSSEANTFERTLEKIRLNVTSTSYSVGQVQKCQYDVQGTVQTPSMQLTCKDVGGTEAEPTTAKYFSYDFMDYCTGPATASQKLSIRSAFADQGMGASSSPSDCLNLRKALAAKTSYWTLAVCDAAPFANFSNLIYLRMDPSPNSCPNGAYRTDALDVLAKLKNLRHFYVDIGRGDFYPLTRLPELQSLSIDSEVSDVGRVSFDRFFSVLVDVKNLKHLGVNGKNFTAPFKTISQLANLESLGFDGPGPFIEKINSLDKLKTLDADMYEPNFEYLRSLEQIRLYNVTGAIGPFSPSLTRVRISGFTPENQRDVLSSLAKSDQIKELTVWPWLYDENCIFPKNLEFLSVTISTRRSNTLRGFDELKSLKTLSIVGGRFPSLEPLASLPKLEHVTFEDAFVPFSKLASIKNLKSLGLHNTLNTEDRYHSLQSLNSLENLNQLESLYVGDAKREFDNAVAIDLKFLKSFSNLKNLGLAVWKVSSLETLLEMPPFQSLSIRDKNGIPPNDPVLLKILARVATPTPTPVPNADGGLSE